MNRWNLEEALQPKGPLMLLVFANFVAAALLVFSIKDAPILWDEWGMIVRASGLSEGLQIAPGGSELAPNTGILKSAFEPWNNHLIAFATLFTGLALWLFGTAAAPFIVFTLFGLISLSALLYFYSRSRIGPWLALLPALVPLFFAGGSEFFGTGIQFSRVMGPNGIYSLLFGLGALTLIQRETRLGDITASILLALSLLSFSYGLSFLVGTFVGLIFRPNALRRLYIIGLPFVLYGLWWLWAGQASGRSDSGIALSNALVLPAYFVDSFSAISTSLFGLTLVGDGPATSLQFGAGNEGTAQLLALLLLLGVLLTVLLASKIDTQDLLRPSLLASVSTLFALWASQGLVAELGVRMPGSPRYLFAGAILIAFIVPDLFRGITLSRSGILVVSCLTLVALLGNGYRFLDSKQRLDRERAEMDIVATVLARVGPNSSLAFVPGRDLNGFAASMWVDAQTYGALLERYGSLSASDVNLMQLSSEQRTKVDEAFGRALNLELVPYRGARKDCQRLEPDEYLTVTSAPTILVGDRDTAVSLLRYGTSPSVDLGRLHAGEAASLTIPADQASLPWKLAASEPIRYCRTA